MKGGWLGGWGGIGKERRGEWENEGEEIRFCARMCVCLSCLPYT